MKVQSIFLCALMIFGRVSAVEIAVGASKEEVLANAGKPRSTAVVGSKEIFIYGDTRVVFENERVSRVEKIEPVSQVPARSPSKPTVRTVARDLPAVRSEDDREWMTDFPAAIAKAGVENRKLLVLFTGSDWCPPCIRFEREVAHDRDFLKAVQGDFVLLKLDYLRNQEQPVAVREALEKIRQTFGVSTFPTMMLVSPDGSKALRVDTIKPRDSKTPVEYWIKAVDEARLGL